METRMDVVELRIGGLERTMTKVLEEMGAMRETMNALLKEQLSKKNREGDSDGEVEITPEQSTMTTPHEQVESFAPHYKAGRRKLEILVFNGDDAHGWQVRVEGYFRINVKECEKLDAVVIALEERALNWFQWCEDQTPLQTWSAFQTAVIRRFNPGSLHNPLGPLLKQKQGGTVMEFRDQFELHAAPLKKDERKMLSSIFLNGLKDEIQAELKLFNIDELDEMMDRALPIEEKNQAIVNKNGGVKDKGDAKDKSYTPKFRSSWDSNKDKKEGSVSTQNVGVKPDEKTGEGSKGRRLSQTELEKRAKKGLCFKCGDRWGKGHVCKMKHIKLILYEGESSDEEEENEVEEETEELKTLQLSLHSKEGLTTSKSFKVWVTIKGRMVIALIDSGATSSFIATGLINELSLEVAETPVYIVEVGTGEKVRNQGV